MEAMIEARKAGKIRYIGFTGHKHPQVHLRMLEAAAQNKIHFDTVQMPLNVMDAHFRSFEKLVLPQLRTAAQGNYERYKTTTQNDSTAMNPAWLG